jgi:hypothetical protein
MSNELFNSEKNSHGKNTFGVFFWINIILLPTIGFLRIILNKLGIFFAPIIDNLILILGCYIIYFLPIYFVTKIVKILVKRNRYFVFLIPVISVLLSFGMFFIGMLGGNTEKGEIILWSIIVLPWIFIIGFVVAAAKFEVKNKP